MEKILNYIGGEFRPAASGRFFENINPATGAVYSVVADSDGKDVESAIAAARAAFPIWSQTPVTERARVLQKIAALISERADELARAESIDNGKPLKLARTVDIPRCQTNFEYFASAIVNLHGESFPTDRRAINVSSYSPLGIVGSISPWNLPLYLLTWKVAPALAAGCAVVAKPSEVTPMTAYLLSKICTDAGLPPGVLNIVHGTGPNVGAPLIGHSAIKAVTFTGSTATGRSIAQTVAPQFKKMALEMGGKNPNIIFADCDFEKALDTTVRSTFSNQGQICLCGSRIFVEQSIYSKFRDALVARANKLRIGNPLEESTDLGALVSKAHMEKVLSYLEIAKSEGGTILCGGSRAKLSGPSAEGYFVQPTLIEGLSHMCRTNQEEIFGPVATIQPFDSEDDVVMMANSTRYGLSASLWTKDVMRAQRISAALEAGVVWVNTWMVRDVRTPFGGVKESGVGREGGMEALKFFSEVKNVCFALE